MGWRELSMVCEAESSAALEAILEAAGAIAVSIDDAADGALFEPAPGEHPLWRQCRLTGLFNTAAEADAALAGLARAQGPDFVAHVEQRDVIERDWVSENQFALPATRFGERLWVVPPGTPPPADDAVLVELVPGLAFGSGAHESTALCLQWLDAERPQGLDVIDYGCGSGILAIAAARLGAARVFAVDHDPQAITSTRDNAVANGVGDRVFVADTTAPPPPRPADLLVANILAGTLIGLAPKFAGLLRDGARMALAGILASQADDVRAACEPWFDGFVVVARGEWVRISATRNGAPAS